jgi:hypothetical protein
MSDIEKSPPQTSNELVKWLRMLALPMWARVGIAFIVTTVIACGLGLLAYGAWHQEAAQVTSAITLLTVTLPILLIVVALVFGQNSDSRLREITKKTLLQDVPRAIRENFGGDEINLSIDTALRGCVCEYEVVWDRGAKIGNQKIHFGIEINVSKVNVSIWIPHIKLPDLIEVGTPELKPWHHAIAGAISEGYKLNSTPASSKEHPSYVRLVFIREFGPEFLLMPWQRLYFVQDFAFFIKSMLGASHS